MFEDPAYIKQLFIKHANGTATVEETALLVNYLQQGGDAEAMPTPEEIAEAVPGILTMDTVATEQAWQQISSITETTVQRNRTTKLRWMGIAAAAAAVIAAVVLLYHPAPPQASLATLSTGYGAIRQVTLPDGSMVTLNANSTLQYDSIGWQTAKREVWIKGEAFFNVAGNAAGEFKVHAGKGLTVQVLGTRFNVVTSTKGVQVVLNTGKVKVNLSQEEKVVQELVLQPGEMVAYNHSNGLLSRLPADTLLLTSWKDNQFTFQGTTLGDIGKQIEEQFGVKVTFASPQLAQLQFTGTTPANDLDVMLAILKKSLDIRIDKYNNEVMIQQAR